MEILGIIVIVLLVIAGLVYLAWEKIGDADIKFKIDKHTPFVLESSTDNKAVFTTEIEIANEGKQCATIMDCFVRSQLPYEQFDKVEVRAKAELLGSPREDDYFEAVLIQKFEKIKIMVKIELTARHNEMLNGIIPHIVDVPVDVVYQHTARHEASLSKHRLVLPAAKIAKLMNVELAD
ncbi:hypothetical protein [Pectinatus brassicae]|uniref:Uncharacterized protein n=1 Tax=Pectinatus brassicae TaxID=862415 RepID=A0A840UIS3_9FIRM|nr:hypothetical protein [Pectinatus brassicae]MBB5336879.1 hypothetical protein [Pectinatus brassicae]